MQGISRKTKGTELGKVKERTKLILRIIENSISLSTFEIQTNHCLYLSILLLVCTQEDSWAMKLIVIEMHECFRNF